MINKYQFFCIPDSNRKKFTFIDMSSDSFLTEKEVLLSQGFEVEDDVIYAENSKEAVEKFKSNYVYALEEYNTSSNPFYSILLIFQWVKSKLSGKL
ncbi:hypothetical protein [Photobacterium nomapromontoriensis]|uniref:hypothetical protein n=1 Tax=Photobacterium nomapromontoriensis TaxID=2910237 RepID=UPI003D1108D2